MFGGSYSLTMGLSSNGTRVTCTQRELHICLWGDYLIFCNEFPIWNAFVRISSDFMQSKIPTVVHGNERADVATSHSQIHVQINIYWNCATCSLMKCSHSNKIMNNSRRTRTRLFVKPFSELMFGDTRLTGKLCGNLRTFRLPFGFE